MAVLNWCYGASAPDNLEVVEDQLLKSHRYANKLVELERKRRQAAEAAARKLHPDFNAAIERYAQAEAELKRQYDLLKAARSKARRRVDPSEQMQADIDAAKAARVEAAKELSKHKSAAYKLLSTKQKQLLEIAKQNTVIPAGTKPLAEKQMVRANYLNLLIENDLSGGQAEYERDTKQARAESGLYWATYLRVEDAAKNHGKGAPPRFRRWDGTGSVAVQLQNGMTVDKATSGESSVLRLHLPCTERMALKGKDRGKLARGDCWLRVGSDDDRHPVWAVIPFTYHRPLPPDAVIKWAFLDRSKVGQKYEWRLRLTLQTEATRKVRPDNDDTVAVHLGYRSVDGGLRAAVTVDSNGQTEELLIPSRDVDASKKPAELQSIRDTMANAVLQELLPWLESVSVPECLQQYVAKMPHWENPNRLQDFVRLWRDNRFADDRQSAAATLPGLFAWGEAKLFEYGRSKNYRPRHPDNIASVFGLLEFWRRFDKHLLQWAAHQGKKVIARREQLYRTFAARLRRTYSRCVIAKVSWDKLREKTIEGESVSTVVRRNAAITVPGRLTEILSEAFGDDLVFTDAKAITTTCNACGEQFDYHYEHVTGHCHCGRTFDADINAARNTLGRASGVLEAAGA